MERARSVIERNEPQFAPPASPSLREQRRVLLDYLKTKTALEDWHAVWDAAVDLKVLDEQIRLTEAR